MVIYYPYTTLEEKQGILDANIDKTFLRDEQVREKRFVVFDDGVEPPFTIPDEVIKAGFLTVLDYINTATVGKTPAEFLADVKARLGI